MSSIIRSILESCSSVNESYSDTDNIKYLYHWIDSSKYDYVMSNGITPDDDGSIYLSKYPLDTTKGYVLKVKIPDNDNLYDWRDMWYDDQGNEVDAEHVYDTDNPYYIYQNSPIPSSYIVNVINYEREVR